jgi:hypothetical protein
MVMPSPTAMKTLAIMEIGARYFRLGTNPSNMRGNRRAAIYTLWSTDVPV